MVLIHPKPDSAASGDSPTRNHTLKRRSQQDDRGENQAIPGERVLFMSVSSSAPLLDCHNIGVRFGGVTALSEVNFNLLTGEVHGLVGCNGAGKSTLMKVLAGVVPEYSGVIRLDNIPVQLGSPREALDHGIAMVYQELSGIEQLSVAENLFLGRQAVTSWKTVDWRQMNRQATDSLAELDIHIDVRRRLGDYPLVIRQMVEIARGLSSGARVLILDEPTSALSPPESKRLFELIKHLQRRGVAMVFISHFLEDVLAICDRVTILRDGRQIETRLASRVTFRGKSTESRPRKVAARPHSRLATGRTDTRDGRKCQSRNYEIGFRAKTTGSRGDFGLDRARTGTGSCRPHCHPGTWSSHPYLQWRKSHQAGFNAVRRSMSLSRFARP